MANCPKETAKRFMKDFHDLLKEYDDCDIDFWHSGEDNLYIFVDKHQVFIPGDGIRTTVENIKEAMERFK